MKFEFYAGKASLNKVYCAVYTHNDDGYYYLRAEKDGKKIAGTKIAKMTVEEYESLPYDAYNNLVRLQAALAKCDFTFKDE